MTSRQKLNQAGFTLVELAIVLLIVGLLIAGILKGQELIENSRTTATIQQYKSYEAAVNTFRDSYGGLPGDMTNARQRVPGCSATVNCLDGTTANGGNGIISTGGTNEVGTLQAALTDERAQFWLQLALANLVTGIVPDYTTNTNRSWGVTLPQGRLAGGFLVGFTNGVAATGGAAAGVNQMSGHYLTLQGSATAAANDTTTGAAISSSRASQMDLKLDDGQPGSGDVVAIGGGTCYTGTNATAVYAAAAGNTRACSLALRVIN